MPNWFPLPNSRNPSGTVLNLADEIKFRNWIAQHGVKDLDNPLSHYDYRGYWQAQQGGDPNAQQAANQHYPDTYKLPGHPTFSNESQYAQPDAPHWEGDDQSGYRLVGKNGIVAQEGGQLAGRKNLFRL